MVRPDDYIPLFAALSGSPDYVPRWVFGKPDNNLARDVQGPIATEEIPGLWVVFDSVWHGYA
ncbi:MAG: hypothetical protein U0R19_24610 [Bryobacteraceae bacterium]